MSIENKSQDGNDQANPSHSSDKDKQDAKDPILDHSDQEKSPRTPRKGSGVVSFALQHQRAPNSFDATTIHRQSSELKPIIAKQ